MRKMVLLAGCVLVFGVSLSGCSKITAITEFDPSTITKLEDRAKLNDFQILMLENRLKVVEADRGDWILWSTTHSAPKPGVFLAGPPMPFAISAFAHHLECTSEAKRWAARETPSKNVGASEPFVANFDDGAQKTFQCFPKGVRPGFSPS